MEYLTTHDLVWINNIVTGAVNPYDYVTLEACMAGQYRYGESQNVPLQAATLLERVLHKRPFQKGNRRTALIATLTFLNANGYATCVPDSEAAVILRRIADGQLIAPEAVNALAAPAKTPLPAGLTLRNLISFECNTHLEALRRLSEGD